MEAAEKHLPRLLCPVIKASYGHALSDSCPYFHAADFLVADATCDGKKKMFELLARIKPLHVLNLPQTAIGEASLNYWVEELRSLMSALEAQTGQTITDEALREQIALYNAYRAKKREVFELNLGEVPSRHGQGDRCHHLPHHVRLQPARAHPGDGSGPRHPATTRGGSAFVRAMRGKPRILLTGCPITNRKVLDVIEESGAVVAAMENCGGLKTLGFPVPEEGDPLRSLAKRYLATACSCMSPNTRRLELLQDIIGRYHIDGVVELTWEACHTYNVEAYQVREFVENTCQRPYIQIRTDYSPNDTEQIRTRLGAFLEMLDVPLNRRQE